ncbi:MAG TPA: hypothetical protein VGG97_05760 [Bryobacteraceae bacterium]|jgi:hypothetical protein
MHPGEYFWSLLSHWLPLMSCAAFTFVSFWQAVKEKSKKWLVCSTGGLALIFLLTASYQAWNDEYIKTHPGLKIFIEGVETGRSSSSGVADVLMVASASSVNTPTIAVVWKMRLTAPDGRVIGTFWPVLVHDNSPITLSFTGHDAVYNSADALYRKTADDPIPVGGRRTGFLLFLLREVESKDIDGIGVKYELMAKDVDGNEVIGSFVNDGSGGPNMYPFAPGMKEPALQ